MTSLRNVLSCHKAAKKINKKNQTAQCLRGREAFARSRCFSTPGTGGASASRGSPAPAGRTQHISGHTRHQPLAMGTAPLLVFSCSQLHPALSLVQEAAEARVALPLVADTNVSSVASRGAAGSSHLRGRLSARDLWLLGHQHQAKMCCRTFERRNKSPRVIYLEISPLAAHSMLLGVCVKNLKRKALLWTDAKYIFLKAKMLSTPSKTFQAGSGCDCRTGAGESCTARKKLIHPVSTCQSVKCVITSGLIAPYGSIA